MATSSDPAATPVLLVHAANWEAVRATLEPWARAFAEACGFEPKPGRHLVLPGPGGAIAGVLFGLEPPGGGLEPPGGDLEPPGGKGRPDPFALGRLPALVPEGRYRLSGIPADPFSAALAWTLGQYRFDRYRKGREGERILETPEGVDAGELGRIAAAVAMGRDLVNTPANDMGPEDLELAARRLAERHGASVEVTAGDDLLDANLPLIHAVGRAAAREPRLIDIGWGDPDAPEVVVVGKGVCFDTGGLDIKPSAGMLLMKKDMGGAAAALALADMVMGARLRLRLRVLIPAVENAISGSSFRPGDVLRSRLGLTVEIGNTDAEGRLILADALALADEEAPRLIVDFATLTGAARVALGPDLPGAFTDDEELAADLARIGPAVNDPVWRLPLWAPYERMLDGKVADITNAPSGGLAGAVTAALFLRRFVTRAGAHLHLDLYAWTPSARPGRPEGGEVQGARLVYGLLKERFGGPQVQRDGDVSRSG